MLKYRDQLKYKYKSLRLSSPEETLKCKSSEYVSLLLTKFDEKLKTKKEILVSGYFHNIIKNQSQFPQDTDRSMTDKESLTFADILKVSEENKVILIEGGPGMGKSTLAIKICKCWVDNEILEEYDAVILLPLRRPEIQGANNIDDLLLVENKNEREALYDEITASQGDKICFILEGYDELPETLRKDYSLFVRLSERLPKCTLMYTSRPEACYHLRQVASQKIEILGFREEQVNEYIDNAFKDVEDGIETALKLKSQIKSNLSISSILSIPINVAIICHLFLLTSTLPNTVTELYTLLCLNLILRHIKKHSISDVDYLDSLHGLPVEISEEFSNLCLIAYRGMEDDKIVFSSREIKVYGIDAKRLSGLGLLLIAPNTTVYGREKSYNFLHLTVQEYFAAFYISTFSSDKEQYEYFKKHQFNNRFQMMWRMYSGITSLKNKDIFYQMLPSKWVESQYRKKIIINLLQCLYEALNDKLCHELGSHLEGNIDLSLCSLDQITCAALGRLLEQYREALKLVILNHCGIDDEGCSILLNLLLSHDNNYFSYFELSFWNNKISDKSSLLMKSLLSTNYTITKLNIGRIRNKLSSSTEAVFKSLQQNNVLTELYLRFSSLRPSDMQSLWHMLTINNTLTLMDISDNDIGSDGCEYLADCRNISLSKLIMDNCKLGVSGADKIGEMLYHNKSITSIGLGHNSICDDGVKKLVEYLKFNKVIKHLGIWDNKITSSGAKYLKELFCLNHTTVNNIQLSDNPLKDEGVDLILQSVSIAMEYISLYGTGMTSSCSSVHLAFQKVESVSFTPLDDYLYDSIGDSLADTTVLKELKLVRGTDISNQKMTNALKRNNSIKKLRFKYGQLHHQTLSDLVEVIKVNNSITDLTIDDVDISSSDYLLLADLLTVNTSIKEMVICPQIRKGLEKSLALQFLKKIGHNHTLKMLTLRVADTSNDDQFIRDVEILVEDMNNTRKSHGVTTLHVKVK